MSSWEVFIALWIGLGKQDCGVLRGRYMVKIIVRHPQSLQWSSWLGWRR